MIYIRPPKGGVRFPFAHVAVICVAHGLVRTSAGVMGRYMARHCVGVFVCVGRMLSSQIGGGFGTVFAC